MDDCVHLARTAAYSRAAAEWAEKSTGTRIGLFLLLRVLFFEGFWLVVLEGICAGAPVTFFDDCGVVFFETRAAGFLAGFFGILFVGLFAVFLEIFFDTFFDVALFCMR
jgi:hypothetical protein